MGEAFLDFKWPVYPTYHWQDWLDAQGKPVVVPKQGLTSLESATTVTLAWQEHEESQEKPGPVLGPDYDSGKPRYYRPMRREHAALFRRFADLDFRDRDAILTFVSTYGLLRLESDCQSQAVKAHRRDHYAVGESLLTWAHEVCLMREALRLARTRSADEEAQLDAHHKRHRLDPEHGREDDRKKLARLINQYLQHVQPHMTFEKGLPPGLSFTPLTLLSAMWLQLALALADDKQFQACKFCHRLFEISTAPTGFRTHREFCSDSCKTKDYRRRKRMALRLAEQGKSVRTIAKQTKTNVVTIRTWVQAGKSRRNSSRKGRP